MPDLTTVDRAALVRLCKLGKLTRRADGYGTATEFVMTTDHAAFFKHKRYAVTGWKNGMYPTRLAHAVVEEGQSE